MSDSTRPNRPSLSIKGFVETNDWVNCPQSLPGDLGAYLLFLDVPANVVLPDRFATSQLDDGHYLYAGSAYGPGGIRARAARHLRRDKSRRWHVDWLTTQTTRQPSGRCI